MLFGDLCEKISGRLSAEDELDDAFKRASNEALSSFGCAVPPSLFL